MQSNWLISIRKMDLNEFSSQLNKTKLFAKLSILDIYEGP